MRLACEPCLSDPSLTGAAARSGTHGGGSMRATARVFPVALLLSLALGGAVPARAETALCTAIGSMPVTITTQGIYCLTTDFNLNLATGAAITVNTNNVVIDLNGHKIGNLAAGSGTLAKGVYAVQRQNITIKNGTIRR